MKMSTDPSQWTTEEAEMLKRKLTDGLSEKLGIPPNILNLKIASGVLTVTICLDLQKLMSGQLDGPALTN